MEQIIPEEPEVSRVSPYTLAITLQGLGHFST
jgi:hypothetical protein